MMATIDNIDLVFLKISDKAIGFGCLFEYLISKCDGNF
jgi:hypothetical protein